MARTASPPPEALPLAPVAGRVTIQDGVYQQLRTALMAGRFDPGQTLTIAALSESFGTSHMPVREALRRLAAEGAVEIATSGSACVPPVSAERLDDLCRARIVNEGMAAELAAPRIGADDLAALEANMREHRAAGRAGDVPGMLARNMAFHFAIYRLAASPVLLQIIENLWLRFGPYMRMLSTNMVPLLRTDYSRSYTSQHDAMIAAARRGEVAAFRGAMEDDIRATQALVRQFCLARG